MEKLPAFLNPLYLFRLAVIGVVFMVVSIGVLPIFFIRAGDHRNNRIFCNAINFLLLRVLGIRLVVDKSDAIYDEKQVVAIANHQGVMDVISCGAVLPHRSATLAKLSLSKIPVWGAVLRLGGNILVDR